MAAVIGDNILYCIISHITTETVMKHGSIPSIDIRLWTCTTKARPLPILSFHHSTARRAAREAKLKSFAISVDLM